MTCREEEGKRKISLPEPVSDPFFFVHQSSMQDITRHRRPLQHNLDNPFPEGKTGKYVKFSEQIKALGWNNVLNEV